MVVHPVPHFCSSEAILNKVLAQMSWKCTHSTHFPSLCDCEETLGICSSQQILLKTTEHWPRCCFSQTQLIFTWMLPVLQCMNTMTQQAVGKKDLNRSTQSSAFYSQKIDIFAKKSLVDFCQLQAHIAVVAAFGQHLPRLWTEIKTLNTVCV